uniref:RING-type domain-containing protein n=1 Tax=Leersia perrieri TaxID=77586 RepID=A0A0D9VHK1_9ORYZ
MEYDAMAHDASSPAARDAKKKRGNRSAKLKQSKLDVRREQWLSQVKDGKEVKAVVSPGAAAGANSGSPILASPHPPLPRRRAEIRTREGEPEDCKEDSVGVSQDAGSSDLESPTHSPVSYRPHVSCLQQKHCSGNGGGRSFSSGSSAWSSSRSVTDSDDDTGGSPENDDDGVLDDWEAVADALSVDDSHNHQDPVQAAPPVVPASCLGPDNAATRQESIKSRTKAWSPDDVLRPQSLPSLSKQASFPASMGNCWVAMGIGSAQKGILSSCPICYEDLDPTDSSFLPCPCGFHLCLFCHKRILEADGRCPGCRKQYTSASSGGGTVGNEREMGNLRLFRSCSMGPRY